MGFFHSRGKTKTLSYPSANSVGYTEGDLLMFGASGEVVIWDSATGSAVLGVCRSSKAATDTTNSEVSVQVPIENFVEWEFDSDSDLATADVGTYRDVDTNSNLIANTSVDDTVLVTRVISAIRGVGVLTHTLLAPWRQST